jgi:hypothetical protein
VTPSVWLLGYDARQSSSAGACFPVRRRQRGDVLTDLSQSTGPPGSDTVDTLILDLLEWIGPNPRPYAEVLEAWRTSCPRLPVWEDATDRGFIARHHAPGRGALVSVSAAGAEHLRKHRQPSPR